MGAIVGAFEAMFQTGGAKATLGSSRVADNNTDNDNNRSAISKPISPTLFFLADGSSKHCPINF